jgi:hypothetical protein
MACRRRTCAQRAKTQDRIARRPGSVAGLDIPRSFPVWLFSVFQNVAALGRSARETRLTIKEAAISVRSFGRVSSSCRASQGQGGLSWKWPVGCGHARHNGRVEKFVNVEGASDGGPYACPCCGFITLTVRSGYEICPVCFWEDDGQDDHDADIVRGGPNGLLSLTTARVNFRAVGACDRGSKRFVRDPMPAERPG